ncbi:hypothetical protein AB0V93_30400, partial [Mesorhizobium ciceri]|uniref:hypothetical protein n=1 Tax=Mesorhizobium ciceri TaxID=39645 RepID=UPI00344CA533
MGFLLHRHVVDGTGRRRILCRGLALGLLVGGGAGLALGLLVGGGAGLALSLLVGLKRVYEPGVLVGLSGLALCVVVGLR